MRKPLEFDGYPAELIDLAPFGPYRAVVERVIDGDSLYALVDMGLNQYSYIAIRIAGIDAPEIFSGTSAERARGQEAKTYLESLVPPGTPVVLRTEKDRASFGRYVAEITLAGGRDAGAAMVAAGMASPKN